MAFLKFAATAIKNLFSKPATEGYPFKEREYPERSRGHIEIDIDKCVMCSMCQKKCPSGAITVDRTNKTWTIDRMGCVQCANCVNSCPRQCLTIVPGYTAPSEEKTIDVYEKKKEENTVGENAVIANDFDKCILCTLCARKCPQGAITVDRNAKTWTIDRDKCIKCGACIDACIKMHALSFKEGDIKDSFTKEEKEKSKEPVGENAVIANDFDKCILCTLCARKCPQGAITVDRNAKTWSIDRNKCIKCGACIDACLKMHAISFKEGEQKDSFKKES